MATAPDQLGALRPHLLHFAQLQSRGTVLAEDTVVDTILVVPEHPERFADNASLKTYVIGILKHKIIGAICSGWREVCVSLLMGGESDGAGMRSDETVFDSLFTADGYCMNPLSDQDDPDAALLRREFFDVLQVCADRLPPHVGRIFMMREWLELETDGVCQELQITVTSVWALPYHARMRLRECLDLHWFGNRPAAARTVSLSHHRERSYARPLENAHLQGSALRAGERSGPRSTHRRTPALARASVCMRCLHAILTLDEIAAPGDAQARARQRREQPRVTLSATNTVCTVRDARIRCGAIGDGKQPDATCWYTTEEMLPASARHPGQGCHCQRCLREVIAQAKATSESR